MEALDVISGLVKASVFGFLITLMGCYHGYHSRGGAQGVGAATTNAVVSASILILSLQLPDHGAVLRPMTASESTGGTPAAASGHKTPKIRIRDVYKSFGDKQVLAGMDLDVGAGESVVVIGGSGTGKSVTLKCVLGLLQPEEGSPSRSTAKRSSASAERASSKSDASSACCSRTRRCSIPCWCGRTWPSG